MNSFEIGILDFIREQFACNFFDWFFPLITKFADHGIGWIITAIILLCFILILGSMVRRRRLFSISKLQSKLRKVR